MKIKIAGQEDVKDTVTLELIFSDEVEGEAEIKDNEKGWSIISFCEVGGRLSLVRHRSIDDDRFNLNEEGQIEEVDE